LGTLFIAHGWPKLSNLAGNIRLWQSLHLPLPAVLGPAQAVVEFFGGTVLLAGLGTRLISFLLAVNVLGAILVVDIHNGTIIGLEWLALWVSLGLVGSGAGSWSLDELLRSRSAPSGPGAVILFDGVCNLCNAWVNFIIDRDQSETFSFGAQQSAGGRAMLETLHLTGQDLAGIILVAGGRVYTDSTAILEICRRLPRPWQYVALLRVIPRPVRDAAYHWVTRRRYKWFGKSAACRVPTAQLRRRFLA